eukprot:scaffold4151_cov162-Amphora_coffeaeformis.AAC.4
MCEIRFDALLLVGKRKKQKEVERRKIDGDRSSSSGQILIDMDFEIHCEPLMPSLCCILWYYSMMSYCRRVDFHVGWPIEGFETCRKMRQTRCMTSPSCPIVNRHTFELKLYP